MVVGARASATRAERPALSDRPVRAARIANALGVIFDQIEIGLAPGAIGAGALVHERDLMMIEQLVEIHRLRSLKDALRHRKQRGHAGLRDEKEGRRRAGQASHTLNRDW